MRYSVVDFRELVSMWYNEFLPSVVGDRAVFVEDAGILYLKPLPLESMKPDSLRFFADKLCGGRPSDLTYIVAQEPKPVNNIHCKWVLRQIANLDFVGEENKLKILHLANRRYIPVSMDVMVSQDKDIDSFLDFMFNALGRLNLDGVRTYAVNSLDMTDFLEIFNGFFPSNSIVGSPFGSLSGMYIKIVSSNSVIKKVDATVSSLIAETGVADSERDSGRQFILNHKKTMLSDMEGLV